MNLTVENLPFKVEVASADDMAGVTSLRAFSYGRHLPELGEKLKTSEVADQELGCEVLVAKSKLDGSVLGTLRTHANVEKPIPLQASIKLPDSFDGTRMVEATRLCVRGSPGSSLVRSALFKALYQYCLLQKIDWLMAAGRHPIDRIYDSLLFNDVHKKGEFYPMAHASEIPHRVMCFSLENGKILWENMKHPMYAFVCETTHKDIDLSGVKDLSLAWGQILEPTRFFGAHAPQETRVEFANFH